MSALESLIESSIDRLVRTEGYAQSCTPETTALVAEYFAKDTKIPREPYKPAQLSFALAA